MTAFRWWASRRGVVIPAAGAGKLKTTIQNIFIGAVILWFAFRDARKPHGLGAQPLRRASGTSSTVGSWRWLWPSRRCSPCLPSPSTSTAIGGCSPALADSAVPMNIELVTIGTELLLGFTVDTNGAEVARALAAVGVSVVRRTSVSDTPDAIRDAVRAGRSQRTGAVLTTGGLGPTRDDISKQVVAELFGAPLDFDERVWADAGRAVRPARAGAGREQPEPGGGAAGRDRAPEPLGHRAGAVAGGRVRARRSCCPACPARCGSCSSMRSSPGWRRGRADGSSARGSSAPPAFPSRRLPSAWARSSATSRRSRLAYLPGLDGVDLRVSAWRLPPAEARCAARRGGRPAPRPGWRARLRRGRGGPRGSWCWRPRAHAALASPRRNPAPVASSGDG